MIETTMSELCGLQEGQNSFNDYIGLRDVRIDDDGGYYLILTVTENMLNPYGKIHGAVLFALCDSAAGSYLKSRNISCVTLSSEISFYRTAQKGDVLTAHVRERKMGRTVNVLAVEVLNQDNQMIADSLCHMYRIDKEDPGSE
ncbi:MAG: PaaI family thioesterase [Oscillospiraceae bacterium]|nr:PaaI family thioesterase [Oscillospiraceae bacterium]